VVGIGKCKQDSWNAYYEKELDVRFSRSGPGRYDPNYGSAGSITRSAMCAGPSAATCNAFSTAVGGTAEFRRHYHRRGGFDDAAGVYEAINRGELRGLGVVFSIRFRKRHRGAANRLPAAVRPVRLRPSPAERVRLGVIGAATMRARCCCPI
jgi:hypothetical protein